MVEPASQEIRVQRRPVLGDEHIPGILRRFARHALLGPLPPSVFAEQPHGVPVQRDQAAARGGLGRSDGDQVAVGDALLLGEVPVDGGAGGVGDADSSGSGSAGCVIEDVQPERLLVLLRRTTSSSSGSLVGCGDG